MNISPYGLALIAGGFTIVGAFIGGWIGYRTSLTIYRISEFNKAAVLFRTAFLPMTTYLKHDIVIEGLPSTDSVHEMLRNSYIPHLRAFEVFKTYLPATEKSAIDLAWAEYCYPKGVSQDPNQKKEVNFKDYKIIGNSEGENKAKEVARQHINKILDFANPK